MNELASRALFDAELGRLARFAKACAWVLNDTAFPVIDVSFSADGRSVLRIRLRADNWNEQPASVELLTADGIYLPAGHAPRHSGSVFHQGPHPSTGRPFVCMVGTREYHTHPSHISDHWDNYRAREHSTLLGLLTQIWNAWRHSSP